MAFKEATGDLKSTHRGVQVIRNYVVCEFYNFVTNLIIY
jgi:hypothetical protein